MPYDPGTHNISGQIYAKFMGDAAMAAAQLRLQGAQSMAQGLSSLGSSLGKGITSGVENWQQSAMTRDFMGSQMEGFAQQGLVSPEMMEKFHKGSLGAQQGIFAQTSALYNTWLKSQEAEQELGRTVRLRQSEADISRQGLGQRTYVQDPNDPNKWIVAGTQTGSASYSPVTEKERQVSNKPGPIFVEGGAYDWKLNPQGYWEPDYTKVLKINKPITQPLPVWQVGTPGAPTAPTGP
jgi:hypothetical protein